MLSSVIGALKEMNQSTDPAQYLSLLTEGQIESLYVLFVEAP